MLKCENKEKIRNLFIFQKKVSFLGFCIYEFKDLWSKMLNEYPQRRERERERENLSSFWDNYEHFCSLQSTVPLALVKAQLQNATLDINADKLKYCLFLSISLV